jgi:hypothetical protein
MEGTNKEQRIFPLAFLECHAFTFLYFSQKNRISEECNKDLKIALKDSNDFIASEGFMAPENEKIIQELQAGMFL